MDKDTLAAKIAEADIAYYNTGNPIMSDEECQLPLPHGRGM